MAGQERQLVRVYKEDEKIIREYRVAGRKKLIREEEWWDDARRTHSVNYPERRIQFNAILSSMPPQMYKRDRERFEQRFIEDQARCPEHPS